MVKSGPSDNPPPVWDKAAEVWYRAHNSTCLDPLMEAV
jgi:hypothetical protein